MHHQCQHVVVGAQPDQRDADGQVGRDVETGGEESSEDGLQFVLTNGRDGQGRACVGGVAHDLVRTGRRIREHRAQRFVAFDQVCDGRLECRPVECPGEPHRERQVVGRGRRVELVEEPHPLLGRRQRNLRRPFPPGQCRSGVRTVRLRQSAREFRDGRRLEQVPHRDRHVEFAADPGHQLGGDQRVAAEVEETVVDAHPVESEYRAEHRGDGVLDAGGRCDVFTCSRGELRCRQGLAVQFPARVQRELVEHHDRRRQHVRRKRTRCVPAQVRGVDSATRRGNHIRHQMITRRGIRIDDDRSTGHIRMRPQHRLDLTQLDPLTTELHLEIGTPDVLEHPVPPAPHQITRAVHPRPGTTERIRHEPIRRQIRPAQIPPRQLDATEIQLPRHPHRNRMQPRIQHIHLGVPLRHTDRHRHLVGVRRLPVRHRHRGLGRPVQIVQPRRRHGHGTDSRSPAASASPITNTCRKLEHDPAGTDATNTSSIDGTKSVTVTPCSSITSARYTGSRCPSGVANTMARTDLQRPEEPPHRHVERRRRLLQQHIPLGQPVLRLHPHQLVHDRRMRHRHTLRLTRRPRREDHVGGVVRAQRSDPIGVGDARAGEVGQVQRVDGRPPATVPGSARLIGGRGQHADRLRGLEHVPDALGRMIRIDRHIRATRLDDRVHPHHQIQRAPHRQRHPRLRPHTARHEIPGQPVHPRVELRVRQRGALEDQRRRARRRAPPVRRTGPAGWRRERRGPWRSTRPVPGGARRGPRPRCRRPASAVQQSQLRGSGRTVRRTSESCSRRTIRWRS